MNYVYNTICLKTVNFQGIVISENFTLKNLNKVAKTNSHISTIFVFVYLNGLDIHIVQFVPCFSAA